MPILPDNILSRMSPSDRKTLGKAGQTSAEAATAHEYRNERELQRLICQELNRREIAYFYQRSDKKTTGTIGWPDFSIFHQGITVFFEIKFGNGSPSEEQTELHVKLRLQGFRVYVVNTFADFMQWLNYTITIRQIPSVEQISERKP